MMNYVDKCQYASITVLLEKIKKMDSGIETEITDVVYPNPKLNPTFVPVAEQTLDTVTTMPSTVTEGNQPTENRKLD